MLYSAFIVSALLAVSVSAFPAASQTSASSPAPTNVICNVDYSKQPSNQPIIEACCNSAGGLPVNFKEAKIEGCQDLILRSTANYKFVGCVQDKLNITPACSNADPVPRPTSTHPNPITTQKPTSTHPNPVSSSSPTNVICNVDYSKMPANQPIIESCCKDAGGYPINFKEAKFEGCQNLILRSTANYKFVGCVQDKLKITPACSNADPVPVSSSTTSSPTPTLTPVYCDVKYSKHPSKQHALGMCCHRAGGSPVNIKSSKTERCENLILRGLGYDKFVGCASDLGLKPACYNAPASTTTKTSTTTSATASVAPIPTNVICTVDYSKKPTNQPVIEACCKSAGGFPQNFKEAKFEGCQNLTIGSKAQNDFVSCVRSKLNTEVECETAPPAATSSSL